MCVDGGEWGELDYVVGCGNAERQRGSVLQCRGQPCVESAVWSHYRRRAYVYSQPGGGRGELHVFAELIQRVGEQGGEPCAIIYGDNRGGLFVACRQQRTLDCRQSIGRDRDRSRETRRLDEQGRQPIGDSDSGGPDIHGPSVGPGRRGSVLIPGFACVGPGGNAVSGWNRRIPARRSCPNGLNTGEL